MYIDCNYLVVPFKKEQIQLGVCYVRDSATAVMLAHTLHTLANTSVRVTS